MALTNREKRLVTLLIIVMVIGVYLKFLVFPQLEKIQQYSKELDEKENILNVLQQTNTTETLSDKEQLLKQQMQEIESKLPTHPKFPKVYREFVFIANETGIQEQSISIESPKVESIFNDTVEIKEDSEIKTIPTDQLMKISISHQFIGTYEQIKQYISCLQSNDRRVDITQYQLSRSNSGDEKNNVSAWFRLQAYALLEEGQNYSQYVEYDFMENHYGRENPFGSAKQSKQNEEENQVENEESEMEEE